MTSQIPQRKNRGYQRDTPWAAGIFQVPVNPSNDNSPSLATAFSDASSAICPSTATNLATDFQFQSPLSFQSFFHTDSEPEDPFSMPISPIIADATPTGFWLEPSGLSCPSQFSPANDLISEHIVPFDALYSSFAPISHSDTALPSVLFDTTLNFCNIPAPEPQEPREPRIPQLRTTHIELYDLQKPTASDETNTTAPQKQKNPTARDDLIVSKIKDLSNDKISPADLLLYVLDENNLTNSVNSLRNAMFRSESKKLEKMLDLVMKNKNGKKKLEGWMRPHAQRMMANEQKPRSSARLGKNRGVSPPAAATATSTPRFIRRIGTAPPPST